MAAAIGAAESAIGNTIGAAEELKTTAGMAVGTAARAPLLAAEKAAAIASEATGAAGEAVNGFAVAGTEAATFALAGRRPSRGGAMEGRSGSIGSSLNEIVDGAREIVGVGARREKSGGGAATGAGAPGTAAAGAGLRPRGGAPAAEGGMYTDLDLL